MFSSTVPSKGNADTVARAREARRQRQEARQQAELEEQQLHAVLIIQKHVRGSLAKRRLNERRLEAIISGSFAEKGSEGAVPALDSPALFRIVDGLLNVQAARGLARPAEDARIQQALHCTSKQLLASMNPPTPPRHSYAALLFEKKLTARWVTQLQRFMDLCFNTLATCTSRSQTPLASSLLAVLLVLSDTAKWTCLKGLPQAAAAAKVIVSKTLASLCTHHTLKSIAAFVSFMLATDGKPVQPVALASGVQVSLRLLSPKVAAGGEHKTSAFGHFAVTVLATPALTSRLRSHSQPIFDSLRSEQYAVDCMVALSGDQKAVSFTSHLDGNSCLFLLGNLIELYFAQTDTTPKTRALAVDVLAALMTKLSTFVGRERSNVSTGHLILGWFSGSTQRDVRDALPIVLKQLRQLWHPRSLKSHFEDVWFESDRLSSQTGQERSSSSSRLRRLFAQRSSAEFVNAEALMRILATTNLLLAARSALTAVQREIVSAVAYYPQLVQRLWTVMQNIGPKGDMNNFLDAAAKRLENEPLLPLLQLACDATVELLSVVDDTEIFDASDPVTSEDLCAMSAFLNRFVFKLIWRSADRDAVQATLKQPICRSAARLLAFIRDVDARRPFVPSKHWLLKEASPSALVVEYKKERSQQQPGRAHAALAVLPHIVPFHDRVKLLRTEIKEDHEAVRGSYGDELRPYITIRRTDVLEDGMREIMRLDPNRLRDTVRITFVNEQGVREAGIDEHGLFKEFLEETLKAGFAPEFGLFTTTAQNRLCPNRLSSVHDQHLRLFEYLGRMVGKMVYDGIMVELPLAHYFLNSMLGRINTINDLPSVDPDLHRNLMFIKSYEGDVEDLALTFAVDEEAFGQRQTISLCPAGSTMDVTTSNRILYVHLMADYKLNKQHKQQTESFLKGFKSVLRPDWLRWFSSPELQRLLSGDDVGIDLEDLKRHSSYIGGYHSSHRVIRWLWEVVRDMNREQQSQFLKFVTSCSRPPVLGFSSLTPPFTIRCMGEGDREESYTLGSAVRNFFSRGTSTERLPSSSTCFNLLKLPPYASKRVLREKLLYAIGAGAGFELA